MVRGKKLDTDASINGISRTDSNEYADLVSGASTTDAIIKVDTDTVRLKDSVESFNAVTDSYS
jgi:hypothetical protein